ncbi:MAG: Mth938-like domain-containing protein [Thermodesulfobacteriota bacterium]
MITSYEFGRIVIDGRTYTSDVLITPRGVNGSWWRKSGHSVVPEDIGEMVKAAPDTIILGQGKPGLMKATKELRNYLKEQGIVLIEEPTAKAVETFNRMTGEGANVCAGFHLTC